MSNYIIRNKNTGETVYKYTTDDNGNLIILDKDNNIIDKAYNTTDIDMIKENLHKSGYHTDGINYEEYPTSQAYQQAVMENNKSPFQKNIEQFGFIYIMLIVIIVLLIKNLNKNGKN